MKVFWDPVQLDHTPRFFLVRGQVKSNFEIPARAESLLAACLALGLAPVPPAVQVSIVALTPVHDPAYVRFLQTAYDRWRVLPEAGPEVVANTHAPPEAAGAAPSGHVVSQAGWYMADAACPIGEGTWRAALAAASCALAAADEAAAGRMAYALVRPPGHHAYRAKAGGHCYLNNAALAAERLRHAGAQRVAVLDIDSHHGNGTQGIFWERPDVLFVSLHADPDAYYPWFTGRAAERGGGAGEGTTLNLPQPMGTGDAAWLAALDQGLDAIRAFGAEALVVSLGFDASEHEPLAALRVTADGFARAGAAIGALRRPTAIVQEGGYAVDGIGEGLGRFLSGCGG